MIHNKRSINDEYDDDNDDDDDDDDDDNDDNDDDDGDDARTSGGLMLVHGIALWSFSSPHYSVIVRATTCDRARRLGVQGALLIVAVRVKLALDMQHYQLTSRVVPPHPYNIYISAKFL
ncbi:hypothetical protein KQX54_014944 [Cotesia glomerata]|uniref:Uncharacterized protein n=1 Tax=Cotesia glomerata TaxID=32391 RepID=A0AAV7IHP7_COTGL|nr:hypothetical protein KQX54_014944 [Cotesia glomerata]